MSARSAPQEALPRLEWDGRPVLRLGGVARIEFRARLGTDLRNGQTSAGDDNAGLDIARRRIGLEGRLFRVLDFQIERELQQLDPWKDVYGDSRLSTNVPTGTPAWDRSPVA